MRTKAAVLAVFLFALPVFAIEGPRPLDDRELENLVALARLTGYVRYFHPSDSVGLTDWNRFTVDAVREVADARDARELAVRLSAVFGTIAPTLRVFAEGMPVPPLAASLRKVPPTTGLEVMQWRHRGLGTSTAPPQVYSSTLSRGLVNNLTGQLPAGFDDPSQPLNLPLGSGLRVMLPIALFTGANAPVPVLPRRRAAGAPDRPVSTETLTGDDRATRLAAVMLAWAAMEHFYPYWNVVGVDWDAELVKALRSAATDVDGRVFQFGTLTRFSVSMRDGHNRITGPHSPTSIALAPVIWTIIDDELIVIRSTHPDISPGDEVLEIDGRDAMTAYRELFDLAPGARDGFKRAIALQRLRQGAVSSSVRVKVQPAAGPSRDVTLVRNATTINYPDALNEAGLGVATEVRPGIWYLDVNRLTDDVWTATLPRMRNATGVIFDFRGYPSFTRPIYAHFASQFVQSAHFRVGLYTRPNVDAVDFLDGQWNVPPQTPRIDAKLAFITDGRAVSYAESIMGIVEHHKLGEIVGEPTAGTNGNINTIELPGGYRWTWTGMLVVKQDGSTHHGVGIIPTVPLSRTRAGLLAGRDELFEKALEIVSR